MEGHRRCGCRLKATFEESPYPCCQLSVQEECQSNRYARVHSVEQASSTAAPSVGSSPTRGRVPSHAQSSTRQAHRDQLNDHLLAPWRSLLPLRDVWSNYRCHSYHHRALRRRPFHSRWDPDQCGCWTFDTGHGRSSRTSDTSLLAFVPSASGVSFVGESR